MKEKRNLSRVPASVISALIAVSCVEASIDQAVNSHFKESIHRKVDHIDLRTILPANWDRVCIAYLPYITRSDVEKKYRGKVVGEYKMAGDANWVILGISDRGDISQIVLDAEVSQFLVNNLKYSSPTDSCTHRTEAVLKSIASNGKRLFHFGRDQSNSAGNLP